jgi:hypothetical protein
MRFNVLTSLALWIMVSACSGGGSSTIISNTAGNPTTGIERSFYTLSTGMYPANMISRNGYFYWSEDSQTPINKLSPNGDQLITLANMIGLVSDYFVNGQFIYWVDSQQVHFGKSFIKKTALNESTTTVLVERDCPMHNPSCGVKGVFADDTSLFWIESSSDPTGPTSNSTIQCINKMSINEGVSEKLACTNNNIEYITGDGNSIYWTEEASVYMDYLESLHKIAKDGTGQLVLLDNVKRITTKPIITDGEIYLGIMGGYDANGDQIYLLVKLPVAGGSLQTVSSYADYNSNLICGIEADATAVYWANRYDVIKISKADSTAVTLAAGTHDPFPYYSGIKGISLNAGNVFWAEAGSSPGTGNIKSVPKEGGATTSWIIDGYMTSVLRSDNDRIYWLEATGNVPTVRIASLAPSTGEIRTALSGIGNSYPIHTFAVDDAFVFIADGETIKKVPVNGGLLDVIVAKDPGQLIGSVGSDGAYLYWFCPKTAQSVFSMLQKMPINGGPIETLVTDLNSPNGKLMGRYYFWIEEVPGLNRSYQISKVSLDTGAVSQIASDIRWVSYWTTDGTNVYFSDQDSGNVYRVSANGGAPEIMFTTNIYDITQLATDGQYVYWVNQTTLAKTPVAGGNTEYILNELLEQGMGIAVDDTNIYWSYNDSNSGGINMATPK